MYSASSDLHAASLLYQCLSLEGLDRYFLCGRMCPRMSADISVCVRFLCGRGLLGLLFKEAFFVTRPCNQPARGALTQCDFTKFVLISDPVSQVVNFTQVNLIRITECDFRQIGDFHNFSGD